jgi:photosystem II stability/assembly factor-like uncharacterized protein
MKRLLRPLRPLRLPRLPRLPIVGAVVGCCAATAGGYLTEPLRGQASATPTPQALAWQASTSGPFTGVAKVFVESDAGAIFARVDRVVFRSRDDGVTWIRCPSQPFRPSEPALFDPWLVSHGRWLYASGEYNAPMQVSEDECESWRPMTRPPVSPGDHGQLAVVNGALFAAYDRDDFFRSRDGGNTWTVAGHPGGTNPRLATRDSAAYLVLSQRLYRSTDDGTTWSLLALDPAFHSILPGGRSLYATGTGGIWRSQDNAATWVRVYESGLTAISVRGSKVYASVFHPAELARSLDDGRTWTRLPLPGPIRGAFALLETRRGTLLAGSNMGIFRSTDEGATWVANGIRGGQVKSLVARRGRTYASLLGGSLWKSDDAGATWSLIDTVFAGKPRPLQWPVGFKTLLVMDDGARMRAGTDRELIASDDGGQTWSASGLNKGANALVRLNDVYFAGTWQGVFRSEDMVRWTECSSGLESGSIRDLIATSAGDLIALESHGRLFRSQDACRSWWPIAASMPRLTNPNATRMSPLLASDDSLGLLLLGDGIAQLPRDQRNWIARTDAPVITAFARDGQGRYWLGTRDGVSRLSIEESAWQIIPTGLEGPVAALAIDPDGYLLAAIDGRGMFRARLP